MAFRKNVSREIEDLTVRLENKAKSARRAANRRMEEGQQVIADLARMYAPEDEGNLGESIKTEKTRSASDGRRNAYEVYIDIDARGSNGAERVGQYAYGIHEGVYTNREGDSKPYNLGKRSLEKDADVGGNGLGWPYGGKVGPKFLTRAFEDFTPKMERKIREAVKKELK